MEEEKKSREVIKFYSSRKQYGEFSNFFGAPITIDGKKYKTTEHYYQVQKFAGSDDKHSERIYNAKGALEAKRLSLLKTPKKRADWQKVKDEVMFKCCMVKFTQNERCKKALLSTGNAILQEDSPTDYYWGIGKDGSGKNMLGVTLMKIRDELQAKNKKLVSEDLKKTQHKLNEGKRDSQASNAQAAGVRRFQNEEEDTVRKRVKKD